MTKVVRFAPSPTGFLHIGNARTALFNWFYARHHGGTFLLRIEDTDRARSTQAAIDAIVDGLSWLGITWDGDVIYQSTRLARHAEVAHRLLETGRAYRCYCTPEELADMRERAKAQGRPPRYDGRWRDRDPSEAPPGVAPVIRLKAPTTGDSVVLDGVQGEVRVGNEQLDDMVLLRGDGSPTYMLAVVVDDHDMGVTQVIRGSDHLTNTFRQIQIFDAMDWPIPAFAHIPLIHGPDGAKLSKRHGALGVDAYRDMGFLPEALRNYLLRLGWSHGDDEVFTTEQAIAWFDLDAVGRSPARFDLEKLTALNARYLREADDRYIADLVAQRVGEPGDPNGLRRLHQGIGGLKQRARTLVDLAESARIYTDGVETTVDDKARAVLDDANRAMVKELADRLELAASWTAADIEGTVRAFAEATGATLGAVAQPLRAAVTGRTVSPGIFDVMVVLGRSLTLARARRSVT